MIAAKLIFYDGAGAFEKVIRRTVNDLSAFEEELVPVADILARKRYELMGRERDLPEIEVISLGDE